MNKTILVALTGILMFGSALSVNAATNLNSSSSTIYKIVTAADLGVQDVGTLPTSNWYFFKEWRRGIQRFFIFNATVKAEFELKVTNEKAAEMIEVQEGGKNDGAALHIALENYTHAQEQLKTRLAKLTETSENPNVKKLLEKVDEKIAQHTALLNQLSEGWNSDPYVEDSSRKSDTGNVDVDLITNGFKKAQEKTEDTVVAAALKETDVKQKAAEQIVRAAEEIKQAEARMKAGLDTAGGMTANGASVVGGLVPGGAVISAAVSSVSQLSGDTPQDPKIGSGDANIAIGDPGVNGNRAINTKGTGAVAKSATLQASASPGGVVQNKVVGKKDATAMARKQKAFLASNFRLSQLLTNAKDHLARAKKSYAGGSYGEAFGLAQSAEVMATEVARISTNLTIERQTPKRDFGDKVY